MISVSHSPGPLLACFVMFLPRWWSRVLYSLNPGPGHLLLEMEDPGRGLPVGNGGRVGGFWNPLVHRSCSDRLLQYAPRVLLCPDGLSSPPPEVAKTGCGSWRPPGRSRGLSIPSPSHCQDISLAFLVSLARSWSLRNALLLAWCVPLS